MCGLRESYNPGIKTEFEFLASIKDAAIDFNLKISEIVMKFDLAVMEFKYSKFLRNLVLLLCTLFTTSASALDGTPCSEEEYKIIGMPPAIERLMLNQRFIARLKAEDDLVWHLTTQFVSNVGLNDTKKAKLKTADGASEFELAVKRQENTLIITVLLAKTGKATKMKQRNQGLNSDFAKFLASVYLGMIDVMKHHKIRKFSIVGSNVVNKDLVGSLTELGFKPFGDDVKVMKFVSLALRFLAPLNYLSTSLSSIAGYKSSGQIRISIVPLILSFAKYIVFRTWRDGTGVDYILDLEQA